MTPDRPSTDHGWSSEQPENELALHPYTRLCALPLAILSATASALPITVSEAGYWLETVGTNTIGLGGGGAPGGVVTALFDAFTSPTSGQGTTATANYSGVATNAPIVQNSSPSEWARRVLNPSNVQLQPLTVVFQNGTDTATFIGRSLVGVTPVPLVQGLTVDSSANPYTPTVSWSLPDQAGFEIDTIQLVFYSNTTHLEIGNRVLLAPTATSFTFSSVLPAGLDLTVNVRLYDLIDNRAPLTAGNILAASRTYVNDTVPAVPEPASAALLSVGVGALALFAARRRRAT